MASTSGSEIKSLERVLHTFLNRQLHKICLVNGLRTGGVKAEMQRRIINALTENLHADHSRYVQIRSSIHQEQGSLAMNPTTASPPSAPSSARGRPPGSYYPGTQTQAPSHSVTSSAYGQNGYGIGVFRTGPNPPQQNRGLDASRHALANHNSSAVLFKNSPFYTLEAQVGMVRVCEAMSQHRNTIQIPLKVSEEPQLHRCANDKSLRVMVFCAGDDRGPQDIAFPHQAELKVNGGEIKANLRGLKSKPGSTRPVDITSSLRLDKFSYQNNLEFTYALTVKPVIGHYHGLLAACAFWADVEQKFFLAIYVVRMSTVEHLVATIKGRRINKMSVIRELTKAAHDPDVVATSQVLSLKCPLSYTRLTIPCRSTHCKHVQCFDAVSYLQLQEQGPQWICPVCNNSAAFGSLAVDEYVLDILEKTSQDQVTIEPDGSWGLPENDLQKESSERPRPSERRSAASAFFDDDDDLAILADFNTDQLGLLAQDTQTPSQILGTPTSGAVSRQSSSAPRSNNNSSRKRSAEVIDLTISSDEDDAPIVRAPKRQHQRSNLNSLSLPHDLRY